MLNILISAFISLGMIVGAFNYTEQHPKFGASQTISSLTALTSPAYDDLIAMVDTSPTPTTKKMTWAVATSSIKTDFDTIYSSKFTTSSGLASILTDETGSGGGFTRATSSVLESPTIITSASIAAPTFDVAGTDATGDIWYRNLGGLFTRLAMPPGIGYYLTGSTTLGIPQWDNTILSANNIATVTFNGVTYVGQFAQYKSSTTINTSTGPVPVFVGTSTNALNISEADVATTTDFLGFATSTNVTNGATGTVQISGIVSGFSGLTPGLAYYVQDTRGTIGTAIGTGELYVGTALSSTQILLDRKDAEMQYVGYTGCSGTSGGTASLSCDSPLSNKDFARIANVKVTASCGSRTTVHQYILPKKNNGTAGTMSTFDATGAGSNGVMTSTGLWNSTSSIRVTASNSGSTGCSSVSGDIELYR